jgi:hypothetical protein
MSIVDDRIHVLGDRGRNERLWQTYDQGPPLAGTQIRSHTGPAPAGPGFLADTGDQLWQARLDLVVSSGLSGDSARESRHEALQARAQASFDELRQHCQDELRPVLECATEMLEEWGIEARVTETLRDEPARVPRGFDLALGIDRFGERGPGKLTITATEGCDFIRLKLTVGPAPLGGDVSEHVGTTIARDLSDALVGGLVATLVEQIFSP